MITSEQIRAARALLGWSQPDLARASGIAENTLRNIERGTSDPRSSTLSAIERAFDEAGVMFIDLGVDIRPGGRGVRFKAGDRP